MVDSAGSQLLTTSSNEELLKKKAIIAFLDPGEKGWKQLIPIFNLELEIDFPIRIAVAPGEAWSRDFEYYSFEEVRLIPHKDYPEQSPPNCSRVRVFHYEQKVTLSLLERNLFIQNRPCIEQLNIEDQVYVDVRGLQYIKPALWSEKILALLKGAWLITRDNNLLPEGELGYELKISAVIETMAQKGHDKPDPPQFTVAAFAAHWRRGMSRTNIYNIVPKERWGGIEARYIRRWEELHRERTRHGTTGKH